MKTAESMMAEMKEKAKDNPKVLEALNKIEKMSKGDATSKTILANQLIIETVVRSVIPENQPERRHIVRDILLKVGELMFVVAEAEAFGHIIDNYARLEKAGLVKEYPDAETFLATTGHQIGKDYESSRQRANTTRIQLANLMEIFKVPK